MYCQKWEDKSDRALSTLCADISCLIDFASSFYRLLVCLRSTYDKIENQADGRFCHRECADLRWGESMYLRVRVRTERLSASEPVTVAWSLRIGAGCTPALSYWAGHFESVWRGMHYAWSNSNDDCFCCMIWADREGWRDSARRCALFESWRRTTRRPLSPNGTIQAGPLSAWWT